MNVGVNLREISYSLSDALDLVGIDDHRHGKRVTFMAAACARALEWKQADYDEVVHAAMIHDCGVSSSGVHQNLINELQWHGENAHCVKGHDLLTQCRPLSNLAPIVLHHHTRWDHLGDMNIEPAIALKANCIYLTDRVDALMAQRRSLNPLIARNEVRALVAQLSGSYFNPELVEAFVEASAKEAFWFTMMGSRLNEYLHGWLRRGEAEQLAMDDLRSMAYIYADIVDAKSSYTAQHSQGVANLARQIGQWCGLDADYCNKLELSGLLHDIGKLRVPDAILDKPGPLTEEERAVMARHSYDAYLILGSIKGLEEIAKWAALHHETPKGSGYPFHTSGDELPMGARILAVADVFQALAQDRPYRDAVDLNNIAVIMKRMAENNELDVELVSLVLSRRAESWQLARYPMIAARQSTPAA